MKKILAFIFIGIFLLSFTGANGEIIATIDMDGLEFIDISLAQIFQEDFCSEESFNQALCDIDYFEGKITSMVSQEALMEIQNMDSKAAGVIKLHNQIQEYVQKGTEIVEPIEISDELIIRGGMLDYWSKVFEIGNMLNSELEANSVRTNGQIWFESAWDRPLDEYSDWTPIGQVEIILDKEDSFIESIVPNSCIEIIKDSNGEEKCVPQKTIFNDILPGKQSKFKINAKGEVISAGFYVNENGGKYLLGNQIIYAPPYSIIDYSRYSNKIDIGFENGAKLKKFQEKINDSLGGAEFSFSGYNIELPNGDLLNGDISYKDGNFFIKPGEMGGVQIGDVEISSPKKENLIVFFDGETHEEISESYVSINSARGRVVLDAKDEIISKLDLYSSPPYSERLTIKNIKNTQIILDSRLSQNLIPELKIIEGKNSNYNALIGEISVFNKGGEIKTKINDNLGIPSSSSRLAIIIEDQQGNNLLGTKDSPQKIIINDFNQFIFTSENFNDSILIGPSFDGFEKRLVFDYSRLEDIRKNIVKDFGVEITGNPSLHDLKRVKDLLDAATPEMISGVNEIEILGEDEEILWGFTSGIAKPYGRKISMLNYRLEGATLLHEMAHTRTYELFQEPDELYAEEFKELRLDYLKNQISEEEFRFERDKLKHKYSETEGRFHYYLFPKVQFIKEWETTARNIYGQGLSEKRAPIPGLQLLNIGLAYKWDTKLEDSVLWGGDGINEYGPKNGFVEPYGANDILEDVATFVEAVYEKPELFEDLLNPASESYDPRYLEKLTLLEKYGFIKEEAYNSIVAGL